MSKIQCKICGRFPLEIPEYQHLWDDEGYAEKNVTVEQFMAEQEGTYNPSDKSFYCTECYIKAGMPLNEKME